MAPTEELRAQLPGEGVVPDQELQHRAPEALDEKPLWNRRQRDKRSVRKERPLGGKDVNVRVEVRQVPEGLHEQDQPRAGAGQRLGVCIDEHSRGDAAKLAQPRPMSPEDGAQEPREGEHVLAVPHRREDVRLDPIAVEEHALLVTTWAEVAGLAGVREQIVVPAGVAVDAGEAVVRVAALQKRAAELRDELKQLKQRLFIGLAAA